MIVLWKVIHGFNAILIKIPIIIFTEVGKTILKFIWKQIPWAVKAVLRRKNTVEVFTKSDLKFYYIVMVTRWYWYKIWTGRAMEEIRVLWINSYKTKLDPLSPVLPKDQLRLEWSFKA